MFLATFGWPCPALGPWLAAMDLPSKNDKGPRRKVLQPQRHHHKPQESHFRKPLSLQIFGPRFIPNVFSNAFKLNNLDMDPNMVYLDGARPASQFITPHLWGPRGFQNATGQTTGPNDNQQFSAVALAAGGQ